MPVALFVLPHLTSLVRGSEYKKTYGTMAGVIVFMVWLWITDLAILLGVEFDAGPYGSGPSGGRAVHAAARHPEMTRHPEMRRGGPAPPGRD
ncbi:hypothetical protein GCM10027074_74480 [Streptomyces deserti]